MNGPEHYREAERLLDYDPEDLRDPIADAEVAQYRVKQAQVHATLALAAATAMGARSTAGRDHRAVPQGTGMHPVDFSAWDDAAGMPE